MLLLDQNLSFRLCRSLATIFPGIIHVREAGLADKDDTSIWNFAAANGLMIVSKDQDFRQRAMLYGPPPKCVWLRLGNCTTDEIRTLLERSQNAVRTLQSNAYAMLIIDRRGMVWV